MPSEDNSSQSAARFEPPLTPSMRATAQACSRPIYFLTGLILVEALIAIPILSLRLLANPSIGTQWSIGLVSAAVFGVVIWKASEHILAHMQRLAEPMARVETKHWLASVVALGLALRCLWVALYPARATSDAAIYLELAGKLAAGQPFASGAGIAYWPPGYPVFLAPFVRLFGANAATVIGINLLLFITALWLLQRLAMGLGGRSVARGATLIFALWPNLIASPGIAAKELLVIPLWLACLLVWLDRRAPPIWGASAAGLLFGATIL